MLAQDQLHDLDANFLNIEAFFANNDDDEHQGEN